MRGLSWFAIKRKGQSIFALYICFLLLLSPKSILGALYTDYWSSKYIVIIQMAKYVSLIFTWICKHGFLSNYSRPEFRSLKGKQIYNRGLKFQDTQVCSDWKKPDMILGTQIGFTKKKTKLKTTSQHYTKHCWKVIELGFAPAVLI